MTCASDEGHKHLFRTVKEPITRNIRLRVRLPRKVKDAAVSCVLRNRKALDSRGGHFFWRRVNGPFRLLSRNARIIDTGDRDGVAFCGCDACDYAPCRTAVIGSRERIFRLACPSIHNAYLFSRTSARQTPRDINIIERRAVRKRFRRDDEREAVHLERVALGRVVDDGDIGIIARVEFGVILHTGDLARLLGHALRDGEDPEGLCLLCRFSERIEIIRGNLRCLRERECIPRHAFHFVGIESVGFTVADH